ncbi:DUF4870 domain-containing protein [Knoellia subterranea]|uniref:DUF4870 domain-containing protein n=1 Tax=Knoellia subterranea KCTC 19937 TaxID=1385521 RepID=A0A0A0JTS7_9MICO|nr:DUF4870 domain-containing protein [Knoellia subterranea]KGN39066.1 hypothetical protein N803_00670 [Knoellia subterranea KCTC 19937]
MTTTPQPEFQGQNPQIPQSPQDPQFAQGASTPPPYQQPTGQPWSGQVPPGQTTAYGQQVLDPAQQRQWGMLSHLIGLGAMIFSAGVAGFVGSLVVYLLFKERGDFVRQHSANSLNVQIMAGIGNLVSWFLIITVIGAIIGIPLLIAVNVWAFVVHIIGAMKANKGELWDPPLAYQFVK